MFTLISGVEKVGGKGALPFGPTLGPVDDILLISSNFGRRVIEYLFKYSESNPVNKINNILQFIYKVSKL